MTDPIAFLFTIGLGPWLTPLRGKLPVLDAWTDLDPVDEPTVREWIRLGYNVGLRTGSRSGVVVIDDDQGRHGASGYEPPPTALAVDTPTGGRHYYYRCPDPAPRNSASKLAPYVDVRGEGGQVVVPPSIHPTTRTAYQWASTGEPGAFPVLAVHVDMRAPAQGYGFTALLRESHAVRNAVEGTRRTVLNNAALKLGGLVAGGALDVGAVRSELTQSARLTGLPESEIQTTIDTALRDGAASPRTPPVATRSAPPTEGILVPGSHTIPSGQYVEQGTHAFADSVLAAIDPAALYRRSGAIGELHGGQFVSVSPERLRTIVDGSLRLVASKSADGEHSLVYRTCTRDQAAVVLEYASVRGSLRELTYIATYPVCVGPEFLPASQGWNADSGVYLLCKIVPEALPLSEARAVLEDLVCDFPFASLADRANYFGLLLTVILRPAIEEPVPMHLIGSPIERTGKTKLAEVVLGCGILGRPTPAMQLGVREEEREKRITAALLAGDSVIHLDNLHSFVDSAALASLLTSSVYRGRELGLSRLLSLPNRATIVGTGNNVHATGEISKRVVPVLLRPDTESPETRQDYRHPLLRQYVESQRTRVLGALLGLVAHWRASGRPLGPVGFGGFERWSSVIGGIMHASGYPEWLSNLREWRGTSDDFGSELREFVAIWNYAHGNAWVDSGELFNLAMSNELFQRKLSHNSEQGRRVAFGRSVLTAAAQRVVSGLRIEVDGDGKRRRARLEPVSPSA